MEDTNEPQDVVAPEVDEIEEEAPEPTPEPTDDLNELKSRIKTLEEKSITNRERRRADKAEITRLKRLVESKRDEAPQKQKTGELDETQLDYLDLKGITDQDEIDLIQKVMRSTGQTVRQALKDEYVVDRLEKLRAQREVKNATPSSTKRSGSGQANDLALAISKFEQTGQLPEDFTLRSAVVNAMEARTNGNKPAWHNK